VMVGEGKVRAGMVRWRGEGGKEREEKGGTGMAAEEAAMEKAPKVMVAVERERGAVAKVMVGEGKVRAGMVRWRGEGGKEREEKGGTGMAAEEAGTAKEAEATGAGEKPLVAVEVVKGLEEEEGMAAMATARVAQSAEASAAAAWAVARG